MKVAFSNPDFTLSLISTRCMSNNTSSIKRVLVYFQHRSAGKQNVFRVRTLNACQKNRTAIGNNFADGWHSLHGVLTIKARQRQNFRK